MVNIYMRSENQWIRALAIPGEDTKRFCHRPLKWLRFVCFVVLGAKGDLFDSAGPECNLVNYDINLVTDLAESYYFFPDGPYHLVDDQGLADDITASIYTPRCRKFRRDVAQRDNYSCVITDDDIYDAAHIIPHSKSDAYIRFIVSERGSLYGLDRGSEAGFKINSVENGMLLSKDLHSRFNKGYCAFLKTPNFALDTFDIPVEASGLPTSYTSRVTLQHIKVPRRMHPIPQADTRVDWSTQNAPPSILLDYMYGVAVIKQWATYEIRNTLLADHHNIISTILPSTPSSLPDDNSSDSEHMPSEHSQAMDLAFAFSAFFRGYPPGMTFATMCQKQEEDRQKRSRQAAQEKVERWLESNDSDHYCNSQSR